MSLRSIRITQGFLSLILSRFDPISNGHGRASESVPNYLRVLLADYQAFERLKQKNYSSADTYG